MTTTLWLLTYNRWAESYESFPEVVGLFLSLEVIQGIATTEGYWEQIPNTNIWRAWPVGTSEARWYAEPIKVGEMTKPRYWIERAWPPEVPE